MRYTDSFPFKVVVTLNAQYSSPIIEHPSLHTTQTHTHTDTYTHPHICSHYELCMLAVSAVNTPPAINYTIAAAFPLFRRATHSDNVTSRRSRRVVAIVPHRVLQKVVYTTNHFFLCERHPSLLLLPTANINVDAFSNAPLADNFGDRVASIRPRPETSCRWWQPQLYSIPWIHAGAVCVILQPTFDGIPRALGSHTFPVRVKYKHVGLKPSTTLACCVGRKIRS